jgi:hypothetical protein
MSWQSVLLLFMFDSIECGWLFHVEPCPSADK